MSDLTRYAMSLGQFWTGDERVPGVKPEPRVEGEWVLADEAEARIKALEARLRAADALAEVAENLGYKALAPHVAGYREAEGE